MSIALPTFTPIEETLYLTLCGRALDNHLAHPILGDTMAEDLTRKLGYDCGRFRLSASPIINIALRAKKLDQVARRFIDQHPNAVGLDLGAGLDTRVFRLDPPAGVDWYDPAAPRRLIAVGAAGGRGPSDHRPAGTPRPATPAAGQAARR
jgi:O-methyltransferase involved in polyketide biosynthesis